MKKFHQLLFILALVSLCSFMLLKQQEKPTLFLVGDSTVRNGTLGRGDGGLWGWGSFIQNLFDTTKISLQNRAMGGTSSRSFQTIGLWDKVLADIKPGDFVLIQFGHNDNGLASIKGNGEETKEIEDPRTKQLITVHSFGYNLRKYISDTKAKGATPIILSLVPRNNWTNGKVNRATNDFTLWAKAAAQQGGALFIDLNEIIADHYDLIGEEKVRSIYFNTRDHTHTIEAGAKQNAKCVVEGMNRLKSNPLQTYLAKDPSF